MFTPLRALGVPEPLIDVVEPFFRVLVGLGYDRSIPPWEPTPARLIPTLDLGKVAADLVNAVGQGVNNAAALVGVPPLLSIPAPVTLAAPATDTAAADISPQMKSSSTPTQTEQGISPAAATGIRQMYDGHRNIGDRDRNRRGQRLPAGHSHWTGARNRSANVNANRDRRRTTDVADERNRNHHSDVDGSRCFRAVHHGSARPVG